MENISVTLVTIIDFQGMLCYSGNVASFDECFCDDCKYNIRCYDTNANVENRVSEVLEPIQRLFKRGI